MSWQQLVTPDTSVKDYAGFCLRFVQSVNGSPARYASAWDAWEATQRKHATRDLPEVSVPCWFEHWGTYGEPPSYANWGHVVQYVPNRGFVSSPVGKLGTYGQSWFATLEEVERAFNAKYVGWSEDINGLQIVSYSNTPSPQQKDSDMIVKVQCTDGFAAIWNMNTNAYQHIDNDAEWKYFGEILETVWFESEAHLNTIRNKYSKVFGG